MGVGCNDTDKQVKKISSIDRQRLMTTDETSANTSRIPSDFTEGGYSTENVINNSISKSKGFQKDENESFQNDSKDKTITSSRSRSMLQPNDLSTTLTKEVTEIPTNSSSSTPQSKVQMARRERRPDREVYVPRARRSQTTPPTTTTALADTAVTMTTNIAKPVATVTATTTTLAAISTAVNNATMTGCTGLMNTNMNTNTSQHNTTTNSQKFNSIFSANTSTAVSSTLSSRADDHIKKKLKAGKNNYNSNNSTTSSSSSTSAITLSSYGGTGTTAVNIEANSSKERKIERERDRDRKTSSAANSVVLNKINNDQIKESPSSTTTTTNCDTKKIIKKELYENFKQSDHLNQQQQQSLNISPQLTVNTEQPVSQFDLTLNKMLNTKAKQHQHQHQKRQQQQHQSMQHSSSLLNGIGTGTGIGTGLGTATSVAAVDNNHILLPSDVQRVSKILIEQIANVKQNNSHHNANVIPPSSKCDIDEQELQRASKEINRSNRRIIKQTFISDVLEIPEKIDVVDGDDDQSTNIMKAASSPNSKVVKSTLAASNFDSTTEDEEDDWESKYDESGDCLDPKIVQELETAVGKVKITQPKTDYSAFLANQSILNDEEFPHVLEVSNFPVEFKNHDLLMVFSQYKESGFDIKWVDDTHALAVFSSSKIAAEVLTMGHPFVVLKPLAEATLESRLKAKKCSSSLQPYKQRPETCAALAKRLVTGALGMRLETAAAERENEKRVLRKAKERKLLAAKQRDEVWES